MPLDVLAGRECKAHKDKSAIPVLEDLKELKALLARSARSARRARTVTQASTRRYSSGLPF